MSIPADLLTKNKTKRYTGYVPRSKIHSCPLLPQRSHDTSICDSVRRDGQVQPVLVRLSKIYPKEFECIDGLGRLDAFGPSDKVWVEVMQLTDLEVFRISNASFNRTERTPKERAKFFAAYSRTLEEQGCPNSQALIAQDTGVSVSELSQLRSINHLFEKLAEANPETKYERLEHMGINKLYELAKLADHPRLSEAANAVENADDMSAEGIGRLVDGILGSEKSDIDKALDDKVVGKPLATQEPVAIPDLREQFRVLHEKAMKTFDQTQEKMQRVLQYASFAEPSTRLSLESEKCLEKIYVGLRRINRYLKKLSRELEPPDQNPDLV